MIDRIVIKNFKSLRNVDLKLGRMNLFIGTNASGKSNFLEAIRVLQGIGNGFTINEILGGKPGTDTTERWHGIRGGISHACFAGDGETGEVSLEVHGRLEGDPERSWEYSITFLPAAGAVARERLKAGAMIYDAEPSASDAADLRVRHHYAGGAEPLSKDMKREQPVLGTFAGPRFFQGPFDTEGADIARRVAAQLANTQRVEPSLATLRQYSSVHDVGRMGDHGEDFAGIVKAICQDEKTKDAYLSWIRELHPEHVEDVGTLSGAIGEPLFMLRENGRQIPAAVLSDGTLRFAAIAAAFFQPVMPHVMAIEEIENGIHANRLRSLVDLLRSQAEYQNTQVFATTHSPTVIEWLDESEHRTTFLAARDESTGASTIRPLVDVPHYKEVVGTCPWSDLLVEGWLETVL